MTRKELNVQAMLESVFAFLGLHSTELAINPNIAISAELLNAILASIRQMKQVQDKTTKGATRTKDELEAIIIAAILKIGAALRAYATEAKNYDLLVLVTFSDSDIKRMRNSNLADKARAICEAALPVAEDLGIYMVTPEDVTSLNETFPEYLKALPASRSILNQTKQSTSDIQLKLNEGTKLLKEKIDVHMNPFKSSNPSLFGEYKNARIIVDRAASNSVKSELATGVSLFIVDSIANAPIADANIVIKKSASSDLAKNVKRTDKSGKAVYTTLEAESYDYEVSYSDYLIENGSFVYKPGMMTEVTVRMRRA